MSEPPGEDHARLTSDLLVESKLGARKQANGHPSIIHRYKAARYGVREASSSLSPTSRVGMPQALDCSHTSKVLHSLSYNGTHLNVYGDVEVAILC